MRALVVIGTRPEAIKQAPVVLALRQAGAETLVCATAQHRDLLDEPLALFGIEPDVDLDVMAPGQTLFHVTTAVLEGFERVLADTRPDWLVVQGDTTTTMAASMAGLYAHVPVAHVEAGLRTHRFSAPYPEEFNRRVTSLIASRHFAPTELARAHLEREGVAPSSILVTGNTSIDAVTWLVQRRSDQLEQALDEIPELDRQHHGWDDLVLVTLHRRENHGEPLRSVLSVIREVARSRPTTGFVYPVHPNPNIAGPAHEILGDEQNVRLLPPQGYAEFVGLMARARVILTDSGGVQEEAPSLGVPVLVARETTERPEGIHAGTARLVGTDPSTVRGALLDLLDDDEAHAGMARAVSPYGTGDAGQQIAHDLTSRPGPPSGVPEGPGPPP